MARDLDFSKRSTRSIDNGQAMSNLAKPTSTRSRVVLPTNTLPTPAVPAPTSPRKPSRLGWWLLGLLIVAIVVASLWVFKNSLAPSVSTNNPSISQKTNSTVVSGSEAGTGSVLTNQTETVDMYDSGAGSEVVKTVTDRLEKSGLAVHSLDQSQFQYDKTYIWYRTEYEAEAQKVAQLLSDRTVELKPTQISGSFNVLIYLGKK